jgi:hypothetical protein
MKYFVMGYDQSVDRFIMLKLDAFDNYEEAHDYELTCAEGLCAFVVQEARDLEEKQIEIDNLKAELKYFYGGGK